MKNKKVIAVTALVTLLTTTLSYGRNVTNADASSIQDNTSATTSVSTENSGDLLRTSTSSTELVDAALANEISNIENEFASDVETGTTSRLEEKIKGYENDISYIKNNAYEKYKNAIPTYERKVEVLKRLLVKAKTKRDLKMVGQVQSSVTTNSGTETASTSIDGKNYQATYQTQKVDQYKEFKDQLNKDLISIKQRFENGIYTKEAAISAIEGYQESFALQMKAYPEYIQTLTFEQLKRLRNFIENGNTQNQVKPIKNESVKQFKNEQQKPVKDEQIETAKLEQTKMSDLEMKIVKQVGPVLKKMTVEKLNLVLEKIDKVISVKGQKQSTIEILSALKRIVVKEISDKDQWTEFNDILKQILE